MYVFVKMTPNTLNNTVILWLYLRPVDFLQAQQAWLKSLAGSRTLVFAMTAVAPQNFWQTKHWTQDGEAVAHLDGSSTASCVSFPSMLNQVGNYLFYRSLSRGYSDMNCYRIT